MKKTKYYAWMMAAALAMTGCSDEMEGPGGEGGIGEGEGGYIKVALNLPTTSGPLTRAEQDGNVEFDDGIEREYEVKDAMLVIFQGATEETATATAAINLADLYFEDKIENDVNVTTRLELDPIQVPKSDAKTYVLAILNNNDLLSINNGVLQYNGSSFDGTISGLQTVLLKSGASASASDVTAEGFLMTNSPLLTGPSGTKGSPWSNSSVYILPQVTVFETEAQASGSAGTDIYVERVVAKVTATFTDSGTNTNDGQITVDNAYSEYAGDVVTLEGWALNLTNKSTYFVRNVGSSAKNAGGWKDWMDYYNLYVSSSIPNRFFGSTTTPPYRVYWAIDPNYSSYDESYFNNLADIEMGEDDWLGFNSETDIAYCLENTFDTEHMRQDQTTGIVFKARYTPQGSQEGSSFFMIGGTSRIYTVDEFVGIVNDILNLADDKKIEAADLTGADGGTYTTSNITNLIPSTALDGESLTTLLADPAIGGEIKYYKDGAVFYYATQIKHFGDYYTPIDGSGTTYVESTDSYTHENHLGRYGVVRNNWYEINVASISGPGEPEIPEEPNHPDDPKEAWIKCNINVLSWAKRKQDVHL